MARIKGSRNKVKHRKTWTQEQWDELKKKVADNDADNDSKGFNS